MTPEIRSALQQSAALLRDAGSLVVIGHVGPDGDAIGSALALAEAARNAGKQAYVTFGEPFVLGRQFRFLAQDLLVSPGKVPPDLDLAVAVDSGSADRLGSAAAAAGQATRLLVIDHHASNGGDFGDVTVIDPTAAATAQLVYHLLAVLEWEITAEIATALYTGLVTDTGRFQYSATSPEVHEITARLLAAGVAPDEVGRHLFEESPFGYLGVAGAVLSRARLDPERSLVWSVLHPEDLEQSGIAYENADGLIDLIRVAEEAEVACLVRQLDGKTVKCSLRSRGSVDVGAVATALGGGGHHNAAGFTRKGTPEEVVELVRAGLS
jgi:phosphoesterase RecJ-like protein